MVKNTKPDQESWRLPIFIALFFCNDINTLAKKPTTPLILIIL